VWRSGTEVKIRPPYSGSLIMREPPTSETSLPDLSSRQSGFRDTTVSAIMRLLELQDDGEFRLTKNITQDIPPYAILSHTWGETAEEVTLLDLENGTGKSKPGYEKIRFCGRQAGLDGLRHFWVDSCCIDKSDAAELQEAINSMFRWYRDAD
jgi:hypothetical protein